MLMQVALLGFMLLRVCSTDPNDRERKVYVMVDPDQLTAIYETTDAPDPCIKILLASGITLYVYGSREEIADLRAQALAEKRRIESKS